MRKTLLVSLCLLLLGASLAQAELAQKGNVRVELIGKMSPRKLPRQGTAPVTVTLGGRVATTDGSQPPALDRFEVAINRDGHLSPSALPACKLSEIQPSTNAGALRACRRSLVGEGTFAAAVGIPEQSPFPSTGRLLAFNGTRHGKPVIFAHVYGTEPLPTSLTLPLTITKAKGTYGTVLSLSMPKVSSKVAFVTQITLKLGRTYYRRGRRYGYVEAGCPAPKGFPGASFPLAKTSFVFEDGRTLGSVLERSCRAKG